MQAICVSQECMNLLLPLFGSSSDGESKNPQQLKPKRPLVEGFAYVYASSQLIRNYSTLVISKEADIKSYVVTTICREYLANKATYGGNGPKVCLVCQSTKTAAESCEYYLVRLKAIMGVPETDRIGLFNMKRQNARKDKENKEAALLRDALIVFTSLEGLDDIIKYSATLECICLMDCKSFRLFDMLPCQRLFDSSNLRCIFGFLNETPPNESYLSQLFKVFNLKKAAYANSRWNLTNMVTQVVEAALEKCQPNKMGSTTEGKLHELPLEIDIPGNDNQQVMDGSKRRIILDYIPDLSAMRKYSSSEYVRAACSVGSELTDGTKTSHQPKCFTHRSASFPLSCIPFLFHSEIECKPGYNILWEFCHREAAQMKLNEAFLNVLSFYSIALRQKGYLSNAVEEITQQRAMQARIKIQQAAGVDGKKKRLQVPINSKLLKDAKVLTCMCYARKLWLTNGSQVCLEYLEDKDNVLLNNEELDEPFARSTTTPSWQLCSLLRVMSDIEKVDKLINFSTCSTALNLLHLEGIVRLLHSRYPSLLTNYKTATKSRASECTSQDYCQLYADYSKHDDSEATGENHSTMGEAQDNEHTLNPEADLCKGVFLGKSKPCIQCNAESNLSNYANETSKSIDYELVAQRDRILILTSTVRDAQAIKMGLERIILLGGVEILNLPENLGTKGLKKNFSIFKECETCMKRLEGNEISVLIVPILDADFLFDDSIPVELIISVDKNFSAKWIGRRFLPQHTVRHTAMYFESNSQDLASGSTFSFVGQSYGGSAASSVSTVRDVVVITDLRSAFLEFDKAEKEFPKFESRLMAEGFNITDEDCRAVVSGITNVSLYACKEKPIAAARRKTERPVASKEVHAFLKPRKIAKLQNLGRDEVHVAAPNKNQLMDRWLTKNNKELRNRNTTNGTMEAEHGAHDSSISKTTKSSSSMPSSVLQFFHFPVSPSPKFLYWNSISCKVNDRKMSAILARELETWGMTTSDIYGFDVDDLLSNGGEDEINRNTASSTTKYRDALSITEVIHMPENKSRDYNYITDYEGGNISIIGDGVETPCPNNLHNVSNIENASISDHRSTLSKTRELECLAELLDGNNLSALHCESVQIRSDIALDNSFTSEENGTSCVDTYFTNDPLNTKEAASLTKDSHGANVRHVLLAKQMPGENINVPSSIDFSACVKRFATQNDSSENATDQNASTTTNYLSSSNILESSTVLLSECVNNLTPVISSSPSYFSVSNFVVDRITAGDASSDAFEKFPFICIPRHVEKFGKFPWECNQSIAARQSKGTGPFYR